jgi:hypothetical protein
MGWIGLENMGHLDHIALETNTNSLFFQGNEGVNHFKPRLGNEAPRQEGGASG